MYTVLKLFRPFEGNCEADVVPSENEFDNPALRNFLYSRHILLYLYCVEATNFLLLIRIKQPSQDSNYFLCLLIRRHQEPKLAR